MADQEIDDEIERIRQIYCQDVLRKHNREVRLLGRKTKAELMSTLLGYELKLGRMRITCPDLASARYLKVFAEIGMGSVRIPYDPTRTSIIMEGLEHALQKIQRTVSQDVADASQRPRKLRQVYARIRQVCRCEE